MTYIGDPRVDAYIAKSADFAKPILVHIRKLVHAACPELTETIRWSVPQFDYKGPMCGMAGFKAHCALWFWNGKTVVGKKPAEAMGNFGRITCPEDLPAPGQLRGYLDKAVALINSR